MESLFYYIFRCRLYDSGPGRVSPVFTSRGARSPPHEFDMSLSIRADAGTITNKKLPIDKLIILYNQRLTTLSFTDDNKR